PFRDWGRIFDVDNTLATAMIDRLMHHGEAMVIQGSSFRTKGETPDESSLSRHHFAQTALAACARAVRHLPETLLEHQTATSAFPFASSREAHGVQDPLPAAAISSQPVAEGRSRAGKPELHSFVPIRVHSWFTVTPAFPSRLRVFA
ncbi:MAG: ATP-binding protein, partial [Planctomyces sp.]